MEKTLKKKKQLERGSSSQPIQSPEKGGSPLKVGQTTKPSAFLVVPTREKREERGASPRGGGKKKGEAKRTPHSLRRCGMWGDVFN